MRLAVHWKLLKVDAIQVEISDMTSCVYLKDAVLKGSQKRLHR
jgi:hypothetical protein